jgi:Xaa-Pro aminopeptidase
MAARSSASIALTRLHRLRELMKATNLTAYVVPTSDAHNSEYPRARDARREFLSGFTGSAGTAVVTEADARLWTDGRYFLQAEAECCNGERGWKLMRDRLPTTPSVEEWLAQTLSKGQTVGIDPLVMPIATVRRIQARLDKVGVVLATAPHENLVDQVWGPDRPVSPPDAAFVHPLVFSGKSASDKIADVRAALRTEGASALLIAALDEVACESSLRTLSITN